MSEKLYCECCHRELNPAVAVWLELDQRTNQYHDFADVPDFKSQGWFPFGRDCAEKAREKARSRRAED